MRSINKVLIVGNVTRDPEMKQTAGGQNVTTFVVATNRQWVTKDGQHHTSSEFHDVVAWARLAEICGQYLKKGKLVYVEGYLKTRSWNAPDGAKQFRTETVAQDIIMLEKRPKTVSDEYVPAVDIGEPIAESEESEAQTEPTHRSIKEIKEEKKEEGKGTNQPLTADIDKDLGL